MVSLKELEEAVQEVRLSLDNMDVYYKLRSAKISRVSPYLVERVKLYIALHKCGLPITSVSMKWFNETTAHTIVQTLHRDGDKHVLVNLRQQTKIQRWILSPLMLKVFGLEESNSKD